MGQDACKGDFESVPTLTSIFWWLSRDHWCEEVRGIRKKLRIVGFTEQLFGSNALCDIFSSLKKILVPSASSACISPNFPPCTTLHTSHCIDNSFILHWCEWRTRWSDNTNNFISTQNWVKGWHFTVVASRGLFHNANTLDVLWYLTLHLDTGTHTDECCLTSHSIFTKSKLVLGQIPFPIILQ